MSEQDRRAAIRASMRAGFEAGVRRHLLYPPSTWTIAKLGERSWGIVSGSPDDDSYGVADYFTTKRAAAAALASGDHPYRRVWDERHQWYQGRSRDPRSRELETWEVEAVEQVRAELGVKW